MKTAEVDVQEMGKIIAEIRERVERLIEGSGGMQCVDRNCDRILASVKMLELNISDVLEFLD